MDDSRQFDPAHDAVLPLNDPMIDAAMAAHWGYEGPHGVKRRKRMQAALVAAAKAARIAPPLSPEKTGGEE